MKDVKHKILLDVRGIGLDQDNTKAVNIISKANQAGVFSRLGVAADNIVALRRADM